MGNEIIITLSNLKQNGTIVYHKSFDQNFLHSGYFTIPKHIKNGFFYKKELLANSNPFTSDKINDDLIYITNLNKKIFKGEKIKIHIPVSNKEYRRMKELALSKKLYFMPFFYSLFTIEAAISLSKNDTIKTKCKLRDIKLTPNCKLYLNPTMQKNDRHHYFELSFSYKKSNKINYVAIQGQSKTNPMSVIDFLRLRFFGTFEELLHKFLTSKKTDFENKVQTAKRIFAFIFTERNRTDYWSLISPDDQNYIISRIKELVLSYVPHNLIIKGTNNDTSRYLFSSIKGKLRNELLDRSEDSGLTML